MKIVKYTLLELMVAMLIFVIMMGVLMTTFSAIADVSNNESVKTDMLIDANRFYTYLSNDVRVSFTSTTTPPEKVKINHANPASHSVLADVDPDDDTDTARDDDNNPIVLRGSSSTDITAIEFISNVTPYGNSMQYTKDYTSDYVLMIKYEFDSTTNELYRNQFIVDRSGANYDNDRIDSTVVAVSAGNPSPAVSDATNGMTSGTSENAVILEGVKDFTLTIWQDYEGGTAITPTFSSGMAELSVNPACITLEITLKNPNPYAPSATEDQSLRTISRTIYF